MIWGKLSEAFSRSDLEMSWISKSIIKIGEAVVVEMEMEGIQVQEEVISDQVQDLEQGQIMARILIIINQAQANQQIAVLRPQWVTE